MEREREGVIVIFPLDILRQGSTSLVDPILTIIIGACVGTPLGSYGAASIALEGTTSPQEQELMMRVTRMVYGSLVTFGYCIHHVAALRASDMHHKRTFCARTFVENSPDRPLAD